MNNSSHNLTLHNSEGLIINSFEIILKVDEGELYNYGAIEVTSELKKLNSDIIRRTIPIEDNELYDASKIRLGIKNIREIAELEGYSFIEINPVLNQNNEKIAKRRCPAPSIWSTF